MASVTRASSPHLQGLCFVEWSGMVGCVQEAGKALCTDRVDALRAAIFEFVSLKDDIIVWSLDIVG